MSKDIFTRIREKLEESTTREPIKEFVKAIISWELHCADKERPQYRETYEGLIRKHLGKEETTAK